MIKDSQTKIPETPRAAAVWKKMRSFCAIPEGASVVVGKVGVVFVELGNKDELANMEKRTS